MSIEIIEKTEEIIKTANLPDRHTYFQLEKFVIGKEPTTQSQLWAIVRELQARKETIEAYEKDLRDAEDNLELFDIKIERLDRAIKAEAVDPNADLNIREYELNIRKLQREKDALVKAARKVNKKMKCTLEETSFLVTTYENIVSVYGEMKPIDDLSAQQEMWNEKLLEEFNLRVILQRPLDPEFIRTVLSIHDEAPVKKQVVALIKKIQNKMIDNRTVAEGK